MAWSAAPWIGFAVLLVVLLAGATWVLSGLWRIFRGKEELQSGGSLGRQLFGRGEPED